MPKTQQLKQLAAAEELYKIIEPGRPYPYEFICFKITGYRSKSHSEETISGEELLQDLPVYVLRASERLKLKADQSAKGWLTPQSEKIYSFDELARKLNVSKRTIERWRKRGLLCRRYIFGTKGALRPYSGQAAIGFSSSAVEEFVKKNEELVEKASKFSTTDPATKQAIIEMVQQSGPESNLSRTAAIKKTAAHFKKAVETVRLIVVDYEQRHKKQIFKSSHTLLDSKETSLIHNMFEAGASIEEIAAKFNKSAATIYRIINRRKIRKLLAGPIDYVMSSEFGQAGAAEKILSASISVGRMPRGLLHQPREDKDWQEFVEAIKKIPALSREQEVELFRRYNFLKYLAAGLVKTLSLTRPCANSAAQAQQYLSEAERIKNLITEANMRLVIRVAGRHATGANLAELISEGNMALMRAVEKFDYTKGFRFSTYASWAIAREFAHFPHPLRDALRQASPAGAERSDLEEISVAEHLKRRWAGVEAVEKARSSLEQVIENNLSEREQYIIRYHFGLTGSTVKKEFKTLKQIGDELGITKERVRQIELIALGKLRQTLSPEEFELLTG